MSIFGGDGIDRELKALKTQVAAKDAQLSTLQNEKMRKMDELEEVKRSREILQRQAEEDADRAAKAEKALESRTGELSQLRLRVSNLESTLQSSADKLKKQEKQSQQLQYELESLGSDGNATTNKLTEQRRLLENKVKDLEKALKIAENNGNSKIPLANKGRRPRSSSVNTDNRVRDLELELESLRSAQGPADAQLDTLREQLKSAKREQDKAVNFKLALERTSKKEIEDLRSKLEDAVAEIDFYRRSEDGGSSREMEKLKKTAEAEKERLKGTIIELERIKTEHMSKIEELQQVIKERAESLSELREDRVGRGGMDDEEDTKKEVNELKDKVRQLELELNNVPQTRTSGSGTDASLRRKLDRAERELRAAREDLEANEALLEEKEKEIFKLKARVPMPRSPFSTPTELPDDGRVEELETRLAALQQELVEKNERIQGLEKEVREKQAALEAALSDTDGAKVVVGRLETELNNLKTTRQALEDDLQSARLLCSEQERSVEASRTTMAESKEEIYNLSLQIKELQTAQRDAVMRVEEKTTALEGAQKQLTELQNALEKQTVDVEEMTALRVSLKEANSAVKSMQLKVEAADATLLRAAEMQATIGELESLKARHEKELAVATEELRSRQGELADSEAHASSLQLRLEDSQLALNKQREFSEEMQERWEHIAAEKIDLECRIEQLEKEARQAEEAAADRSTLSEARERDVELLRMKDQVDDLRRAKESEKEEYEKLLAAVEFAQAQDNKHSSSKIAELEEQISRLEVSATQVSHMQSKIDELESQIHSQMSNTNPISNNSRENQHIGLLHAKIERLRKERDELRQSMSFAQHERQFALSAAEADRRSALDALDLARAELQTKIAEVSQLQKDEVSLRLRIDEVCEKLESVSVSFAAASDEKNNLIDRNAELERQLQSAEHSPSGVQVEEVNYAAKEQAQQLLALSHETVLLKDKLSDTSQTLRESEIQRKELEKRVEELSATPQSPISETHSAASNSEPSEKRRHVRQISSMSGTSKLREAELEGKLSRREATIKSLSNKIKQLETQLELARDSEIAEELEQLVQEKETLKIVLEERMMEHTKLQHELISSTAIQSSQNQRLVELEKDLQERYSLAGEETMRVNGLVLALVVQRKAYLSTRAEYVSITGQTRRQQVALESSQVAANDLTRAHETIEELRSRLAELESTSEAALSLSEQISALQTEKQQSERKILDLQTEVSTLLDALAEADRIHSQTISEIQEKLEVTRARHKEEMTNHGKEVESATERLSKQHEDLQGVLGNVTSLQVRVQELDRQLGESQIQKEDLQRHAEDLQQRLVEQTRLTVVGEENRGLLEEQVAGLHVELNETVMKKTAVEGEMERLKEIHLKGTKALHDLEREAREMKNDMERAEERVREVERLELEIDELRKELLMVRDEMRGLVERAEKAEEEMKVMELENERIRGATNVDQGQGTEELKERISELEAALTLKVQEVDEADDRVREVYKSNTKLEKKIAKLQRQITTLTLSTEKETLANTIANRSIPPVDHLNPGPIPTSHQLTPNHATTTNSHQNLTTVTSTIRLVTSSPTKPPISPLPHRPALAELSQPRPSLRSVNIFDPTPNPSLNPDFSLNPNLKSPNGQKRCREGEEEKVLPAEAIILPFSD
ncbi:hypothetical protein TREMEDRAFT_58384 [Tremella mesenterica DSM 1558]|uniref:uncharacterized protein n=1 Tax=Tremella mesenterica (strain ATCC 24925 / CBS 8224 / DSM 1558 / NBRC 9311 / NRRL Y-6157 / RJB 2259-6 / UBC 559-6) TaxID=578456 RepID=UPI0003F4A46E|nr:uncharacterized protein TREMEDRAFT_58384 [Tremella mesenterica DSM 1558]EIW72223.1 hypothetical protein TREMEDRAFT_58384 [Tremella mesenterica DSM 1558]